MRFVLNLPPAAPSGCLAVVVFLAKTSSLFTLLNTLQEVIDPPQLSPF